MLEATQGNVKVLYITLDGLKCQSPHHCVYYWCPNPERGLADACTVVRIEVDLRTLFALWMA
jgi:hypothetical protein